MLTCQWYGKPLGSQLVTWAGSAIAERKQAQTANPTAESFRVRPEVHVYKNGQEESNDLLWSVNVSFSRGHARDTVSLVHGPRNCSGPLKRRKLPSTQPGSGERFQNPSGPADQVLPGPGIPGGNDSSPEILLQARIRM